MKILIALPALALLLSACAVTPKKFYENPSATKDTPLCRAFLETKDTEFKSATAAEIIRRGLTLEKCQNLVAVETAAVVGIAAVATGVAVAAACTNGCGAPSYVAGPGPDRDCRGGRGDGPYYVDGPVWVGSYDPYHLDADNDGWGCEASDVRIGA